MTTTMNDNINVTTTLDYYNKNASSFVTDTQSVSFTPIQDKFISLLPPQASILDFGCGSGRDTKYFWDKGFDVTAIDGSLELAKIASKYAGIPVKCMLFHELRDRNKYDGIWACSSLLHLPTDELVTVLSKIYTALRPQGILYASFKYGDFEGMRNGRYFTDLTEESFSELLRNIDNFKIIDTWITGDARPGRENEKWLNLILKKD